MNSRMTFLFVQYLLAELVYESRDYNYYTPEKIKLRQQRVKAIDKALDMSAYPVGNESFRIHFD